MICRIIFIKKKNKKKLTSNSDLITNYINFLLFRSDNNNLLDNMIEMMEKYSQGLESRIRELNHEKDEERSKLEKVLYKSLPK